LKSKGTNSSSGENYFFASGTTRVVARTKDNAETATMVEETPFTIGFNAYFKQ
jgi:hypothetical protein